jgi:hypothetical protein
MEKQIGGGGEGQGTRGEGEKLRGADTRDAPSNAHARRVHLEGETLRHLRKSKSHLSH